MKKHFSLIFAEFGYCSAVVGKCSELFGSYLKTWREAAHLTKEEAARRLGIGGKDPGAYLQMIEKGGRALPDNILPRVSEVYGIHPEEVLKQTYWPQLIFLPLIAIVDNDRTKFDDIEKIYSI